MRDPEFWSRFLSFWMSDVTQKALSKIEAKLLAALDDAGGHTLLDSNLVRRAFKPDPMCKPELPHDLARAMDLFRLAGRSSHFLELGLGAGYSALLALLASPSLHCTAIDLGTKVHPPRPRNDIMSEVAAACLAAQFPGRFRFLKQRTIRGFQPEEGWPAVDLVQFDASKASRIVEFDVLKPHLGETAHFIHTDRNNTYVRAAIRSAMTTGFCQLEPGAAAGYRTNQHSVLVYQSKGFGRSRSWTHGFRGKKLLLITAHQDDEVLFSGGLLSELKTISELDVLCCFRPIEARRDAASRVSALFDVANDVGADCTQFGFQLVPALNDILSRVRGSRDPFSDEEVGQMKSHRDFVGMVSAVRAHIEMSKPDIVITHNERGEYGHPEHVFLHYVVREALSGGPPCDFYVFGYNFTPPDGNERLRVGYDLDRKRDLVDRYLPYWRPGRQHKYCYDPEMYYAVDAATENLDTSAPKEVATETSERPVK